MPPASAGPVDHFPSTHATWILDTLRTVSGGSPAEREQAARELRTHIMARYREPLLAYAAASSFRALSSPEDLVHGFFAERLPDIEYLRTWTGTGMRLRRWLCNGLLLHMFGVAKQRRRDARTTEAAQQAAERAQALQGEQAADRAFDRAWARGVIGRAVQAAEQALRTERREAEWTVFARHLIDGVPLPRVAEELGEREGSARAMLRLALRRFEDAVTAELVADGIPPAELHAEAQAILSVFDRGA